MENLLYSSLGSSLIAQRGVTNNTTFVVPAKTFIKHILIINNTANSITGGVKIGTSSGGVDVVLAFAVGPNAVAHINDSALLKRIFSKTVSTTLYLQAVTAWNNTSIDIDIELGYTF